MRLFFLNNQQHNTNEKNRLSFKKTLYNLISRNNSLLTKLPTNDSKKSAEPKPTELTPPKPILPKPVVYQPLHWRELGTAVVGKDSICPAHFLTHSHIRSTRPNPNQLILVAASNESNVPVTFCKVLKKRSDEFVWGKQSRLRYEL